MMYKRPTGTKGLNFVRQYNKKSADPATNEYLAHSLAMVVI